MAMLSVTKNPTSLTAALLLVVVLSITFTDAAYVNTWGEQFQHECPPGQVLNSVLGVHSNAAQDRRWMFTCRDEPSGASPSFCRWSSGYVNAWNEPVTFMCPADFVLAGVGSFHSDEVHDRRMRFKCCKDAGYKTTSCSLTPYLNDWDSILTYNVDHGKVLVGWISVYSEDAHDRRHKMLTCRYRPNQ